MGFHVHAIEHLVGGLLLWVLLVVVLRVPWRSRRCVLILIGILAANAIDVDHLLATPMYDPLRCSITTHPLHHPLLVPFYIVVTAWRPVRYVALGLLLHIGIDGLHCL